MTRVRARILTLALVLALIPRSHPTILLGLNLVMLGLEQVGVVNLEGYRRVRMASSSSSSSTSSKARARLGLKLVLLAY